MAIADYQTLMLPILKAAANGEKGMADVAEQIADAYGLSAEERELMLPSGKQRLLYNRLAWAKFHLTKAGLLNSPARGRFVATGLGISVLAENPKSLDLQFLLKYPKFREFYKRNDASENGEVDPRADVASYQSDITTPEERIDAAYNAMQRALREDLLDRVLQNTPAFFEQVIVDLLVGMGYGGSHKSAAKQLGRSGDGGVDGIINEDRLGLDRVYVQAKRYSPGNSIGRPDVQAFVGSLVGLGATKGVFVTTSSFSQQAKDFVKHLSQRIILIDGQSLADLMIEHNVGVRTYRAVEFKRLDEDFFAEED
jgi:restriction system protein